MPIDLGGEQEDSEGETLSASVYRNEKAQHVSSEKGDFIEPGAIVTTKKNIFTLQHQEAKISNFYSSIGVLLWYKDQFKAFYEDWHWNTRWNHWHSD